MHFPVLVLFINLIYLFSVANGIKQLDLLPGLLCSYNYDLEVHAHRGERSTKELNFKLNALVCLCLISISIDYLYKIILCYEPLDC